MRSLALALLLAALGAAQPKTEIGTINSAQFRIDVPEKWNGALVIYCHGYNGSPGKFEAGKPNPVATLFNDMGYAVAQSGYASGGWAIQEAVTDTEELRRYFIAKYPAPKETYVTGHSMGGFLTMTLMEMYPNVYDGGLALCGPLAPASWFLHRYTFDTAAVFEYYFPGALPSPAKVGADFNGRTVEPAIRKLLEANPAKAEALRRYTGIKTDRELASTVVFFTGILKELQERWEGNPVDNRDTIYTGTGEDDAVNDGVKRYAADPRAAAAAARWYTPTGVIERPMLAIHTTYDPIVPPWIANEYASIAREAGHDGLFAQQYVKHGGHCSITPAEIRTGFDELLEWRHKGIRPKPGAVPAN